MLPRYFAAILAVVLTLSSTSVAADESAKHQQLNVLLAKAGMANLRANGSPAFHLQLNLHAEHITAKPLDGTYDEAWNAPDAWRREIAFPEFKQVEVGDAEGRWVDRSLDFRPHPVQLLTRALDSLMVPAPSAEEQVTKIRQEKREGTELQCVEIGTGPPRHTLCFDELGRLFSIEYPLMRMEYRDNQKFGAATFPRKLRVYEDRELVLEANVTGLSLTSDKPQLHHHSATALHLSQCERWGTVPARKKVPPEYPEEARRNHMQGTAEIYALLAADGKVQKVRLLKSAGSVLDQSAMQAVQQWAYDPISCGKEQPLPLEIEVWVNFALSY